MTGKWAKISTNLFYKQFEPFTLETVSLTHSVAAVKDNLSPYKIHLIWIPLCTVPLLHCSTSLKILEIMGSGQTGSSTASVLSHQPPPLTSRLRVGKVLRRDKTRISDHEWPKRIFHTGSHLPSNKEKGGGRWGEQGCGQGIFYEDACLPEQPLCLLKPCFQGSDKTLPDDGK